MAKSDADNGSFELAFGGDTSLGDRYLSRLKNAAHFKRLESDPLSFFRALEPLVTDTDQVLVNLETVLLEAPLSRVSERKKYCGTDAPGRTLSALRALNVRAVSLANNHAVDFGLAGLKQSLLWLHKHGLVGIGAGEDLRRASRPLKIETSIGNVYIVAGFEFRRLYRRYGFYAEKARSGVFGFELTAINALSEQVRSIRASDSEAFIIAFPHWGGAKNYVPPTPKVEVANQSLWTAGVDLVLGHGAHNFQKCVASGHASTVFSLGNFVFNSPGRYAKFGALPFSVVARLSLYRADGLLGSTLRLYPILSDNRSTSYSPRPATELEALQIFHSLQSQPGSNAPFEFNRDERGWHLVRRTYRAKTSGLKGDRPAGLCGTKQ
jgi:poly-gamma-glutamate capsule biosynthesis protein CapA/YwtB (metallophosphatase superfamily)